MFFVPDHRAEKHQRPAELHMNQATVNDVRLFIGMLTRPHVNMAKKESALLGAVQIQFGEDGPVRVIGNVSYVPNEVCKIPTGALTIRFGMSRERQHTACEINGTPAVLGPLIPDRPLEVQVTYITEKTMSPPMYTVPFEFPSEQLAFLRLLVEGKARQAFRDIANEEYERNFAHRDHQLSDSSDQSSIVRESGRSNVGLPPASTGQVAPALQRTASPRSMYKSYTKRSAEGKRHGPSPSSTPKGSLWTGAASPRIDVEQMNTGQAATGPKRPRNGGEAVESTGGAPFRLVAVQVTDSGAIPGNPIVDLSVSSLDLSSENLDTIDQVYGLDDEVMREGREADRLDVPQLGEYQATLALQMPNETGSRQIRSRAERDLAENNANVITTARTAGAGTAATARFSTGGAVPPAARPNMTRVFYGTLAGDLVYPAGVLMSQYEENVRERLQKSPAVKERELKRAAALEKKFVMKAGFTTVYGLHRRFAHAPSDTMAPFMVEHELTHVRDLPWTTSCGSCGKIVAPEPLNEAGWPAPARPGHIVNLIVMGETTNGPGFAFFSDETTTYLLMWPVDSGEQLTRAIAAAIKYFTRTLGAGEEQCYLRAPAVLKQSDGYERVLEILGVRDADELLAEGDRSRNASRPIIRIPEWGTLPLATYLAYRTRCIFAEPARNHADLSTELHALVHAHNTFIFGGEPSPQVKLHGIVDDRWPFVPRETVTAFVKGEWTMAKFIGFGRRQFNYIVSAGGNLCYTQAVKPCDGPNASTPQ